MLYLAHKTGSKRRRSHEQKGHAGGGALCGAACVPVSYTHLLHALVQQRPAHLGVADEVACAQDDALVAVVAVVGVVCALGVHAGDLAALVLDELEDVYKRQWP